MTTKATNFNLSFVLFNICILSKLYWIIYLFYPVIIIIFIISYLNRKIFRLEHLKEIELERKLEENACKIRCFKCSVKLTYNDITCSNCVSNNIYYNKAII